MKSVSLFAVQDSATKIPVSEAITKGYYVKAKHLATVRKIDVHKGEPACEGLWTDGSMIFSIRRRASSRPYGAETQFNSSLIAFERSNPQQTQAQSGSEPNQN